MGITRKIMSVSTFGLIDFRSDRGRSARSARKTAKQAKKQAKLVRELARQGQRAGLSAQDELLRAQYDAWNG